MPKKPFTEELDKPQMSDDENTIRYLGRVYLAKPWDRNVPASLQCDLSGFCGSFPFTLPCRAYNRKDHKSVSFVAETEAERSLRLLREDSVYGKLRS